MNIIYKNVKCINMLNLSKLVDNQYLWHLSCNKKECSNTDNL